MRLLLLFELCVSLAQDSREQNKGNESILNLSDIDIDAKKKMKIAAAYKIEEAETIDRDNIRTFDNNYMKYVWQSYVWKTNRTQDRT